MVALIATVRALGTGEATDAGAVVVAAGGEPAGGILVGGSEAMPTEQTIVKPPLPTSFFKPTHQKFN